MENILHCPFVMMLIVHLVLCTLSEDNSPHLTGGEDEAEKGMSCPKPQSESLVELFFKSLKFRASGNLTQRSSSLSM